MFRELNTLKPFLENPTTEFSVRETARILKITPATASKELKYFANNRILAYKKERMYDLYKADIESVAYRDLKIYYNIRKIRESGLIEALNRFYLQPTIIFFGSASTGYDTENSDYDIVVISENTKDFDTAEFEKILRPLQIFPVQYLKDLKNEYLINNVLNGIVLQGEIKWM